MVNSASQSLAEFKSQRLGGLLSGTSSTVGAPSIVGTSLSDSASSRMARSAPKRSTTAFLDQIRSSGQRLHETQLGNIQQKRLAVQQAALAGIGAGAAGASVKRSGGSSPSGYRQPSGSADRPSKSGAYGYQPFAGRYGLTVPASDSFTRLESAYRKVFGQNFVVNNGWRSMAEEQVLWDRYKAGKGPMASKPGTGVHGYGTAVDINGPISSTGTRQHAWLRENAAQFGWYWVGQRWGEPWHWEYYPNQDPSRR